MKEKIKKASFTVAEIGTVIWAIYGIMSKSRSCSLIPVIGGSNCEYDISIILAYFLSTVLILYLLRRYKTK